ncbi:MAG: DUF1489 family protein [Candidatus Micropelagos sp.]|uniref:DUF1489 family protein n=1 Tax=PS1 clade bacterium TaxID=2175152 RepID=A0A368EK25_9PROT|nr:hypothetical protein [Hyphomicrobiales bacterium]MBL6766922.1 DUF1489 domain-containing protein [Candidatus Micropelagos sp.]OUV49803.1 MAG: hypothetical protein CBC70_02370 [Alphaproteobacteria bacterium TMED110]RCL84928.1 MAG: DUF1489 family protein [PS1 clade bacterium]HCN32421.1 DUF1489 domain-containing protein [Rhodobiaceae bacterium]
MTLHLIKLAARATGVDDLVNWQSYVRETHGDLFHTTRMMPKRVNELLDDGSIYWVIKRKIRVRQNILDIQPFTDEAGIKRCHIFLDPELIATRQQARRPFQGWRYLPTTDAPEDMPMAAEGDDELPEHLKAELMALGLL